MGETTRPVAESALAAATSGGVYFPHPMSLKFDSNNNLRAIKYNWGSPR
jgi:hypothetical protein